MSAYEHGRKSPSLRTAARLLAETGHELTVSPCIAFVERPLARGRVTHVPTQLPRLSVKAALAVVSLPLYLDWSDPGRRVDLANRSARARVYEVVLREGLPKDILAYIDGVLLVDLWDELVLPPDLRAAWTPVIAEARGLAVT